MSLQYRHVLVCGRRGAGKGTIVDGVLTAVPQLQRMTTYTTRRPREGEVSGRQYDFISNDSFDKLIALDELVAWQKIGESQRSGPSKSQILRHRRGITDVSPVVADSMRRFLREWDGKVLTVGIFASERMRRERIRLRQEIGEWSIDLLIEQDPVTEEEIKRCDTVFANVSDGRPDIVIDQVVDVVRRFLEGGDA